MRCPFCGVINSQVLESRIVEEGEGIRRRRECGKCGKRFTTYEKVKNIFLWVIKKDGRREPFDRDKIQRGILKAIEKRPVPFEKVRKVVDEVEREMLRTQKEEVSSRQIGKAVMRRLKKIDKVAWLRFASVYLEFKDITDFERAIQQID